MTIRPLGTNYLVRLTDTPERTAAGLILPPSLREQWCDAEVLAVGPGMPLPATPEFRSQMWAETGNRVLFQRPDLRLIDDRERIGLVRDEALLGIVEADGAIQPLNSYLLIEFFERVTERASGLLLAEKKQRRPNCGRVARFGPGRLRMGGLYGGTRQPVWSLMNLCVSSVQLVGLTVYFGREAKTLDVYRANNPVEAWLLRAEECLAYPEEEEFRPGIRYNESGTQAIL